MDRLIHEHLQEGNPLRRLRDLEIRLTTLERTSFGSDGGSTVNLDHGSLSGLGDDDHTGYVPRVGGRDFTAPIGGIDPVDDEHFVTLGYLEGQLGGEVELTLGLVGGTGITITPDGDLTIIATNLMEGAGIDLQIGGDGAVTIAADPPGDDTEIVINKAGVLGTADNFVYDYTNSRLGVGTATPSQALDLIGSLELENTTTATTGVIYKDADRFIHNFQHPTGGGAVPIGCNIFAGVNAGNFTTGSTATATYHSSYQTAIGASALLSNTTGYQGVAVGASALYSNTTGYRGVAVGHAALFSNTTGYQGVAVGASALFSNTTGYRGVAVGHSALLSNTTGYQGVAVGHAALLSNTTGYQGVAVGAFTLYDLTEGLQNTAIGYNTGRGITTGDYNTIIGANVIGLAADLSNNVIIADGQGNRRINVDSSGNVGIATVSPDRLLHVEVADAATNSVTYVQRLSHITSGTAVAGFGAGIEFELEENDGSNRVTGIIECVWTDAGAVANADGIFKFKTMLDDGAAATRMVVGYNGTRVGVGTATPAATVESLSMTEQLRLSYDADSYCSFTVESDSDLLVVPAEAGRVMFQPTTDSTTFFQVLDADGGIPIFNVDAVNERVGFGTANPFTTAHVRGDLTMSGKAHYGSPACLGDYHQSFATKEYVYSRDFSDVSSGQLTHVDSDDQGDFAYGVWGDGKFVYLANYGGGLHVYSVSSAGILTHVDSDDPGGSACGVWGDGKFVYLANGNGGLHVYSVSSAGILTHVDSDDPGNSANGVWGDGKFVYLANYGGGLRVYSVSSAGILTHVDSDDQGDFAEGVWGDGKFVYLTNWGGGLHVYSVSSAGILTHVDSDDQGDFAYGVWGDGKFVYLANNTGGLHVYSVSSAGILTHVDSDDQGDSAYGVWGDGKFVYLANYGGGLHVYSVSSAGILTHVDSDDPGSLACGVWGDGKFVYLANNTGGLHVYSVDSAYSYDKANKRHCFDAGILVENHAWLIGAEVLNLDFTGTDYDTKAECNAVGLQFSDSDVPFCENLVFGTTSGAWTHSAGNGWSPALAPPGSEKGPALLLPIMRCPNWEFEMTFHYAPGGSNQTGMFYVGYASNSNHVGAYGKVGDNTSVAKRLIWEMWTNDGDDTFTSRYTGANLNNPAGSYVIKVRSKNGCFSVWDDQDDAWHNYEGRQNIGHSYSAGWIFIQDTLAPGEDQWTVRIESLKLTYLP